MDSPANVHSSEDYEEEDYDVFYDELRKQVLQLTAEEDDDDYDEGVFERKMMNAVEARRRGPIPQAICYHGWPGPAGSKEECFATPAWMVNLWRSGNNGTGVFIPKGVVQSRRKNRSRRKNGRGRMYREVERMN